MNETMLTPNWLDQKQRAASNTTRIYTTPGEEDLDDAVGKIED